VWIYRGVLAVSRDPALRRFALRHGETERRHLARIEAVLPRPHHSRLLPLWRLAGWLTGALPALAGPRAVHITIDAVESFVDRHYTQQIDRLRAEGGDPALLALLEECRADEIHHRDEARGLHGGRPGPAGRLWARLVGSGSALAVAAARRF